MSADNASDWVKKFIVEIPKSIGPVLDLACGRGRHTRLLLDAGYEVWSVDRDLDTLATLRDTNAKILQIDLESPDFVWPFAEASFAGIVVTNYLHRQLMPRILASLMDQGVLIYETFAVGNEKYGRPRNPDFLLSDNELIQHFVTTQMAGWRQQCLSFEHLYVNQMSEAIVQRICVRRCLTLSNVV